MTNSQTVSTELKKYKYSENAFLPKVVIVPLVQEKNVECTSIVTPGQIVAEGEVIAEADKASKNAKIHSPIPGKIEEIVNVLAPNGCYEKAIKISLQGSFNYTGKQLNEKNWNLLSDKTILEIIAENGIVNTFVTNKAVSLAKQIEKINKDNKSLIVRLYDEDRLRLADSLLCKFNYEKILIGARIVAKSMNANQIVIAIDSKSEIFQRTERPDEENIIFLKTNVKKYPIGFKRQIINTFNKSLKKTKGFEIDKNDLFTDAYTMLDVYNGIVNEMPVISHYVNLSGNCLPVSTFLNIKIGFTLEEVVKQLGGFVHQPAFVIINGQICGNAVNGLDVPITKYVKSVEFISKSKKTDEQIYNCTDCGNCRSICNAHISPDLLYKHITKNQEISQAQINSAKLCTECNLCNSVCPARLPLSTTISVLKTQLVGIDNED